MGRSPNSSPGTVISAVQMSSPIILSPESPLSLRAMNVPPIAEMSAITESMLKSISETVTYRYPGAPFSPVTTPCAKVIKSILGSVLS